MRRHLQIIAVVGLSLAAMLIVAGCSRKTPRDFQSYRWVDGTNVLAASSVNKLVNLLEANLVPPAKTTNRADSSVPRPFLAPNLCVNILREDGSLAAQLLGFDGKWAGFGTLGSVSNSNIVRQVYEIVRAGSAGLASPVLAGDLPPIPKEMKGYHHASDTNVWKK
jgi:hypothetical protein